MNIFMYLNLSVKLNIMLSYVLKNKYSTAKWAPWWMYYYSSTSRADIVQDMKVHTRPDKTCQVHTRPDKTCEYTPDPTRRASTHQTWQDVQVHTRPDKTCKNTPDLTRHYKWQVHTRPDQTCQVHTRPDKICQVHTRPNKTCQVHTRPDKPCQVHTRPDKTCQVHTRPDKTCKYTPDLTRRESTHQTRQDITNDKYTPDPTRHVKYTPDPTRHVKYTPDQTRHDKYTPDLTRHGKFTPDSTRHHKSDTPLTNRSYAVYIGLPALFAAMTSSLVHCDVVPHCIVSRWDRVPTRRSLSSQSSTSVPPSQTWDAPVYVASPECLAFLHSCK